MKTHPVEERVFAFFVQILIGCELLALNRGFSPR